MEAVAGEVLSPTRRARLCLTRWEHRTPAGKSTRTDTCSLSTGCIGRGRKGKVRLRRRPGNPRLHTRSCGEHGRKGAERGQTEEKGQTGWPEPPTRLPPKEGLGGQSTGSQRRGRREGSPAASPGTGCSGPGHQPRPLDTTRAVVREPGSAAFARRAAHGLGAFACPGKGRARHSGCGLAVGRARGLSWASSAHSVTGCPARALAVLGWV